MLFNKQQGTVSDAETVFTNYTNQRIVVQKPPCKMARGLLTLSAVQQTQDVQGADKSLARP